MTEHNGTKAPAEKICAYEYTVKRGDSFYLIAHRLGIPLRDLLDANPEVNPARLTVGDAAFLAANVLTGAFNLLPIPPLDGAQMLGACWEAARKKLQSAPK